MNIRKSVTAIVVLGGALAAPCYAQVERAEVEEIVVTGSRLATVNGFNSPTPVTVLQAEELGKFAPNNIADALQTLPVLAGSLSNETGGNNSGNSGTIGQSILDLRGIGQTRTLVLLDGQRMGVSNVQNSVDINMIPQTLVRRVDIVTGGASASYGSDAVAGVVNFILDTTFEGLKGELSAGVSDRSDTENYRVSASFGHHFGERTRLIGSIDHFDQKGVGMNLSGREWRDNPWVANPGTPIPVIPNGRFADASDGGTIRAITGCVASSPCAALQWTQFVNGQLVPFTRGADIGTRFANGGDGSLPINGFIPDVDRKAAFLHLEHDATDNLTLWAQGSYNDSNTLLDASTIVPIGADSFTIFEGNPYLPASVATILANDPGNETFSLSRHFAEGLDHAPLKGATESTRVALGVKGRLNNSWAWDVTASLQDSHQDLDIHNAIVHNLFAAADAVRHPTTGEIVCRSRFYNGDVFVPGGTGNDAGCVPMDLFSSETAASAANDYIMGDNTADIDITQHAYDANLRGDFGDRFQLGAGPLSFATGITHRRVQAERVVDALSASTIRVGTVRGMPTRFNNRLGEFWYYNPQALKGEVKVTEGYAELGVPLLADKKAFKALDLTLAGRITNYSQSGTTNSSKLSLSWSVNDSMRFRSTLSRDIRAPSLLELFDPGSTVIGRSSFPSSSNFVFQSLGSNVERGNPDLTPESAKTLTVGVVLTPAPVEGLQVSVDYFRTRISDAITAIGAQQIVDLCYSGATEYCPRITVNGTPLVNSTTGVVVTDVVDVRTSGVNIARENYEGVDFEVAYRKAVGRGMLSTRLLAYQLRDYDNGNITPICTAGLVGSISGSGGCGVHPEWTGQINLGYQLGNFGVNWRQRYIDSGKVNPGWTEGVNITINDVPSVTYTDLRLNYDVENFFGAKGSVFLNVTNAFDKTPPVATAGSTTWAVTTANGLYDVIGRRYLVGLQASF
jgi:iron complex outermembrane receptor protein